MACEFITSNSSKIGNIKWTNKFKYKRNPLLRPTQKTGHHLISSFLLEDAHREFCCTECRTCFSRLLLRIISTTPFFVPNYPRIITNLAQVRYSSRNNLSKFDEYKDNRGETGKFRESTRIGDILSVLVVGHRGTVANKNKTTLNCTLTLQTGVYKTGS